MFSRFTKEGWKLWEASINWYLYKDRENAVDAVVSQQPDEFQLQQNYPNPFNAETFIDFYVPVMSKICISVLDLQGRPVAQPAAVQYTAGFHQVKLNAGSLPNGVYFDRLEVENLRKTRKMTLLK